MLFSDQPHTRYGNAPTHEVICQLRFPTILSINTTEPADFQEAIRADFPKYHRRQDVIPPKVTLTNGNVPKVEQQPAVINYTFLSEDNRWKINLTKDFIALSTLQYTSWEEFARHLDKLLAAFIKLYKPAYFQRVGLRYVNIFSRKKLGLEGSKWAELISPAYVGPLCEPDAIEENFLNCASDLLFQLDNSCRAKIHAGPGRVQNKAPGAQQDPEVKFIFDMDLSMNGNIPCNLSAAGLEMLHGHATRIFEGAITETTRSAMQPE